MNFRLKRSRAGLWILANAIAASFMALVLVDTSLGLVAWFLAMAIVPGVAVRYLTR